MIGRPPKPNAIKKLIGSRNYNPDEPETEEGIPDCPDHLNEPAKQKWRQMLPILSGMKILAVAYGDLLSMYCQAWAYWIEAEQQLAADGVVCRSPNGYPIINPYWTVRNKAYEQMEKSGSRLGLSPTERSRLQIIPEKTLNPLEKFLLNKPE